MKSEKQIREELVLQEQDLKVWQDKYERSDPKDSTRRTILGNTIVGIEGRIEALTWMLEEN